MLNDRAPLNRRLARATATDGAQRFMMLTWARRAATRAVMVLDWPKLARAECVAVATAYDEQGLTREAWYLEGSSPASIRAFKLIASPRSDTVLVTVFADWPTCKEGRQFKEPRPVKSCLGCGRETKKRFRYPEPASADSVTKPLCSECWINSGRESLERIYAVTR